MPRSGVNAERRFSVVLDVPRFDWSKRVARPSRRSARRSTMSCFGCFGGKSNHRVRLMFVGLDGAGKSTLLQRIVGDPEEPAVPTVGFHNVALPRNRTKSFTSGFDVDVFDLGGGKRIRGIWKAYVADVHACVFVVDSADTKRAEETREVFMETITDPMLSGKPIAIFANKRDLPNARSETEVARALGLETLQNKRYRIISCTSLRRSLRPSETSEKNENDECEIDDGIQTGVRWLLETVREDWSSLAPRVAEESARARDAEEILKKERVERGKRARQERLAEEKKSLRKSTTSQNVDAPASPETTAKIIAGGFGSPVDDEPPPGGTWTSPPRNDEGEL